MLSSTRRQIPDLETSCHEITILAGKDKDRDQAFYRRHIKEKINDLQEGCAAIAAKQKGNDPYTRFAHLLIDKICKPLIKEIAELISDDVEKQKNMIAALDKIVDSSGSKGWVPKSEEIAFVCLHGEEAKNVARLIAHLGTDRIDSPANLEKGMHNLNHIDDWNFHVWDVPADPKLHQHLFDIYLDTLNDAQEIKSENLDVYLTPHFPALAMDLTTANLFVNSDSIKALLSLNDILEMKVEIASLYTIQDGVNLLNHTQLFELFSILKNANSQGHFSNFHFESFTHPRLQNLAEKNLMQVSEEFAAVIFGERAAAINYLIDSYTTTEVLSGVMLAPPELALALAEALSCLKEHKVEGWKFTPYFLEDNIKIICHTAPSCSKETLIRLANAISSISDTKLGLNTLRNKQLLILCRDFLDDLNMIHIAHRKYPQKVFDVLFETYIKHALDTLQIKPINTVSLNARIGTFFQVVEEKQKEEKIIPVFRMRH